MASVKVAILEKDGTELDGPEEYQLVAVDVPFDPTGLGLTSTDVQAAIEASLNSGVGSVVPLQFITSGNTNNKWLGFGSNTGSSNTLPFIVPQTMDLKGIMFSNIDDNVDIDCEVYFNGSLVHTEQIRNKRWSYNVGIPGGPTASQGDRISVFLKKHTGGTGDNTAQDPFIVLYCKFVSEAGGSGGMQYGV